MNFKLGILLSIIAHLALVGLLMSNFQFSKIEIHTSGSQQPQIKAKAVNSQRVEQLVEQLKQKRIDQNRKEKQRLADLKKAEEEAKKRRIEEEKKAEDARKKKQKAEQRRKDEEKKAEDLKKKRIADEKARKKKEAEDKKRKAEAERKRKAEAERKRKAEAERKRKAKEEAERKRKAEEERKRKEAEEKARQEALEREMQAAMDAEAQELATARQRQINSEVAKYNGWIKDKIRSQWIAPDQKGRCTFRMRLSSGGLVLDVEILRGSQQHCETGKRAIYKAEPLPVPKDKDIFEKMKIRTFDLENESDETDSF